MDSNFAEFLTISQLNINEKDMDTISELKLHTHKY